MLLNETNSNILSLPIFSKIKLDFTEKISNYLQDESIIKLSEHISKFHFVMMVFGTINNLLCVYVFASKEFRKLKFNWYLITIALLEVIFCSFLTVHYSLKIFFGKQIFSNKLVIVFMDFVNMIMDFSIHTCDSSVAVLTLLLSLDRLYAIKKPLNIRKFITNLHAKALIIISLSVIILLKTSSFTLCEQDLSSSNGYVMICTMVSPLILNIIPMIIMLILNSFLLKEVLIYGSANSNSANGFKSETTVDISKSNSSFTTSLGITSNGTNELCKNVRKPVSIKKSYCIFIIISASWAILTSIPYYCLNTYLLTFQLNFFLKNFNLKSALSVQIISSAFFNLNHCVNFLLYFTFCRPIY